MNTEIIKRISAFLTLEKVNDLPILSLNHPVGQAKICFQGAQILSWKPSSQKEDVFWLSEIESFKKGVAIRGGVPLCFPWFGGEKSPSHGTARIRLWDLIGFEEKKERVSIRFALLDDDHVAEAEIGFVFGEDLHIHFKNFQEEKAQIALHSYFKVGEVDKVEVTNLPQRYFDAILKEEREDQGQLTILEEVNRIYHGEQKTLLLDQVYKRQIDVIHHGGSDIVVWNPWTNSMSAMSELAYRGMLCVETARIHSVLQKGEGMGVTIRVS